MVAGQLPADQSLHRQTMVDQGHRTAARAGQRECYQVTIQFPFIIIERLWGILNVTVDIVRAVPMKLRIIQQILLFTCILYIEKRKKSPIVSDKKSYFCLAKF